MLSELNALFPGPRPGPEVARSLLAQMLWMIDPSDTRVDNIQSDLANAAILSATGAHWEEDSNDVWNWNTDPRTTAGAIRVGRAERRSPSSARTATRTRDTLRRAASAACSSPIFHCRR